MRIVVLYRPNSEYSRITEEFIQQYQDSHHYHRLEILNVDTRDGIAAASLYEVVEYPAIMVLQDDGYVQKIWQGSKLPLLDEVASYAGN